MKIENYPEIITEGYPKLMKVWDTFKKVKEDKTAIVIAKVIKSVYPYKVILEDGSVSSYKNAEDLPTTKPRTIEDGLVEGDIITDGNSEKLVLGVCGKAIFVSYINDFTTTSYPKTLQEIISAGYKLKQPIQTETIPEMTMEEVCAALGKEIKIKK